MHRSARVLFARLPLPGKVKSRLANFLGEEEALSIYKLLLNLQQDFFSYFESHKFPGKNFVFLAPENLSLAKSRALFLKYAHINAQFFYQKTGDLGSKLLDCAKTLLKKFDQVIIWGADIPTLSEELFSQAYTSYPKNYLVPTQDGGYALIALSRANFHEKIFDNIAWGGRQVFRQQVRNFQKYNLTYELGPKVMDLDLPQDLLRLLQVSKKQNITPFWEKLLEKWLTVSSKNNPLNRG
ncbi:MAG: DUF2064 domain-containing protein [Leptospiraceae bacterium]|nr:DUF2064 domain-containing protein [Leptospiraceae bacterium]MDW8305819.1 DUF2064 domain-containing protein [Leptospiraceae bacterium]